MSGMRRGPAPRPPARESRAVASRSRLLPPLGAGFILIPIFFALLAPCAAFALAVPPSPAQWFTDSANLLRASDAEALNQKLKAFEERSGAQFIIYTFPSLEGEALEDFTIRSATQWKAGQKKYDNGLILFVFAKERKIRIEVGYGLEGSLTDAFTSSVIRNDIAPRFRAGDYAGGLNAAADDLIARVENKETPVPVGRGTRGSARPNGIDPVFLFLIAVIFLFFILPLLRRGGFGGCGGCIPLFIPWGGSGITFGGGGGGGGGFSGGGGGFGGGGSSGGW
jgi:uncharacterized protein